MVGSLIQILGKFFPYRYFFQLLGIWDLLKIDYKLSWRSIEIQIQYNQKNTWIQPDK